MDLMHGSVVELDRLDLDAHVSTRGVAVVCWREHGNLESYRLDRALDRAACDCPEVRFGMVDAADDERLAEEWGVRDLPTLMVFRDGTLVHSSSRDLSAGALETLLGAAPPLDMKAARAA